MRALTDRLRAVRQPLLLLTTMFFTILLLEVDLGHQPAIAEHAPSLAFLPIVWLSVSLLLLIALQLSLSVLAGVAVEVAMGIAAVVGIIGSVAHLAASGVTLDRLDLLFSPTVWAGPACPNWPIAIAVAAVLGFVAAFGIDEEEGRQAASAVDKSASIAFVLIIAGIVLSVTPGTSAASADCFALASLLLCALMLGLLVATTLVRRSS
jgi:hypothetical protein